MSNEIRESIVEWLHTKKYWVQLAASYILAGRKMTDEVLNELLVLLKSDEENSNQMEDFSSFSRQIECEALKLISIGDIIGIDDLSPKTPLSFGDNLSVIYGSNGSGKSGYTRILKKASGKEKSPLASNVFQTPPDKQQCSIVMEIEGQVEKIEWDAQSTNIETLESIDIFDSSIGSEYLEGDSESSYLPIEVSLFEDLVKVFNALSAKLDGELRGTASKLPRKPEEFGNSEYIENMYKNIKPDSNVEKLKEYYSYSEDDEKKIKSLEERVKTSPNILANQKKQRKAQIIGLKNLIVDSSALVTTKACNSFLTQHAIVVAKEKESKEAAEALSNNSKIEGVGGSTWKSMWIAAKKYSEEVAFKGKEYPNVESDAVCVLCHQEIKEPARTRFVSFNKYINSELQKQLNIEKDKYRKQIEGLPKKITEDDLKTRLQAGNMDEESWLERLNRVADSIEAVKANIESKKLDAKSGFELDITIVDAFDELIKTLEKEIKTHEEDAKSFNTEVMNKELNDLKAKKWSSSYIEVMIEEIERLKQISKIKQWQKEVGTNALSRKAGDVSSRVLTDAYVKRFNKELVALGAKKIAVELVKSRVSRGKVMHKLQLKNLNPIFSKVQVSPLSDGEKRIISLAAFLADVTGKPNKSPFIFDDPISSLDQEYEEATAQRLIELSKERQVVVFTHRLSFLCLLNEQDSIHSKYIRRESWGCGEHGELPLFAKRPIKSINQLKNDRLAKAKKIINESGTELGNPLIKAICSDFRILLERIIELELTGGIVQRHQRGIVTKGKLAGLVKITQADCDLLEGLMTEYSKYEHSQSIESPVALPEVDVLEASMNSVIEWHDEFQKRQVVAQ